MPRGGSRERAGRPKGSSSYGEASVALRVPTCVHDSLKPYLQKYVELRKEIRQQTILSQREKDARYDELGNCWDWIIDQLGSNVEPLEVKTSSNVRDLSRYREHRLYSSAVAATPEIINEDDDNTYENKTLDEILIRKTDESFFLKVSGDSMIDAGIDDGSILVVEPHNWTNGEPKEGQIVIALVGRSTQVVKIFYRADKHTILLISANEQYPPIVITGEEHDQLEIQGIVYRYIPPPLRKLDLSKYLSSSVDN